MRKIIALIVFGLMFCIQPVDLFAKTICFAGGGGAAGAYLFLSGGKIDEKPFAGNWYLGSGVTVPAWGAMIKDSTAFGDVQLSFCSPHHPSGGTVNFCGSVLGSTTASLAGIYDNNSDGTFSVLFLAEVDCNTIPTARPEIEPVPGSLGIPDQSEE